MDCPRVRYAQFNDVVEADLADHGYKVMADASEQVGRGEGGRGSTWRGRAECAEAC